MKILNNKLTRHLFIAIGIVCFISLPAAYLHADGETAVIRVGKFWCGVIDHGGTRTFSYNSFSWFPGDFNCMGPTMQDASSQAGSGLMMAATNWTDPLGTVIPKAAVLWSPDSDYNWGDVVTVPMTNYTRWALPYNYTIQPNDTEIEDKQIEDWGTPDASKMIGTSDQVIEVTKQGPMGVAIHRNIFGWSQEHHHNYIVCDVTLTNNSDQTLTDFYLDMHQADFYNVKAAGRDPSIDNDIQSNRTFTWSHLYGAREGDSLRIYYRYNADDPQRGGDQMGMPITNQDGRLHEAEMHFFTVLHASEAPYTDAADDVDDFLQPRTSSVYSNPLMGLTAEHAKGTADRPTVYDIVAGSPSIVNPMEGAFEGTFHEANNDEFGVDNWEVPLPGTGSNSTFHSRHAAFGPYAEFKPGEKLHFIFASGFAELGMKKAKEIGEKWMDGTLEDPPNLPDARTGYLPSNFAFPSNDEQDLRKNRWLSTLVDSVHTIASKAKWNYEHDWQVPMAPEPPHMWVQGTGEGSEIRWAAPEAEAADGFYGYRIMRRVGRADTVYYEKIAEFTADELTSEVVEIGDTEFNGYRYIDTNVLWGAYIYYYVQSGVMVAEDDMNAYPTSRGKVLWSGRLWSTSRLYVSPERPVGTTLDDIRIVPNPYNIADARLLGYGVDADDPRLIMFFNLPPVVTIKIFTESGDLIQTIEHAPLSKAGSTTWNLLTDNQQAISSGVYIAVFETPQSEIAYQKFIVVR